MPPAFGDGTYGSGTFGDLGSAGVATPELPNRLRVRERIPMHQHVIVTSPSGKPYRWSEDGGGPATIDELSDSGSVPGGDKDFTGTFARKLGVDYGDMKRGSRIELIGAGRMKLAEYRLERAPEVSGDHVSIAPAAAGYEAELMDDNTAQEIFLDGEMGAFGEPTGARKAAYPGDKVNQDGQVSLLPAGDPSSPTGPSISHAFGRIDNNGGISPNWAESLYGSGVELGRVLGDFVNVKGAAGGDTNWDDQLIASSDDIYSAYEVLEDFNATTTSHFDYPIAAGRFFLMLRDRFVPACSEDGNWELQWRNLKACGRHGLPLYGTWPRLGLLDADVLAYVLQRWAPGIHFTTGPNGTIRPGQFLLPHLVFKDPTTVGEMVQQVTRFEIPEWGVWPGQFGPTFYKNPRGEREGAKTWRVRKENVEFEDTGQQLDKVFNGVVVQGQATDGSVIYVGPTGSGLRYTSDRCLDRDPQNAANEAGIKRYAKIQMKGIATLEGMEEAAEAFLEQSKLLDGSGKCTITGYVEDEHGQEWPYYCVKEGHKIEVHGSSLPGPRYIVNSSRTRSSRSVAIDIDAPPDGFEAMMERLYAEYVGLALESG